jgi:hypothetical protein
MQDAEVMDDEEAAEKRSNVWVFVPIVVVFVLHFAFFLTWIALATMFDFAYSLEIICLLVVMLFHLFMSVKLVLKIVRRVRGNPLSTIPPVCAFNPDKRCPPMVW